jgi:hypothetical protein
MMNSEGRALEKIHGMTVDARDPRALAEFC